MVKLMKVMHRVNFIKLKQKVNNDNLKNDLVKFLEKSLFGEKEKFEESVAERVKTKPRKKKCFIDPT